MKKVLFIIIILVLKLFYSCSTSSLKDGEYEIEIYSTNDIHGRIFDTLYDGSLVHPYSMASVSKYIKERRAEIGRDNLVLLDIGDNLQGDNSVFYYNYVDTVSEHLIPKLFNYLNYDAVVVGNHDVEAGHRVYDKIKKELRMPYLAANAIDVKKGAPYFEPYTIIKREGLKIGVIGMTNPNIPKWLPKKLWSGIHFDEITVSLEKLIKRVREKEGANLVIVALHAGFGDEEEYSLENPAAYIAKNVKGIDMLFASHDHRPVVKMVESKDGLVLVLNSGSHASNLAQGKISVLVKNGKIVSKTVSGSLIPMSSIPPDPDYYKMFKENYNAIKQFTNQEVGVLNNTICTKDAFFGPSEFVDLLHFFHLNASGAEISFAAPLSYNTTIQKGILTYQDLSKLYPYENQLYVVELTGKEIKEYLEYSYSKWINVMKNRDDHLLLLNNGDKAERSRFQNPFFNFDSAAGIIYEVDATKETGEKVNITSMADGSDFELDKRYRVAMTSYRANGGGDILELGAGIPANQLEGRVVETFPDIRDIIYSYLKVNKRLTAVKLNHWKIVPEDFITEAIKKDYRLLFGE